MRPFNTLTGFLSSKSSAPTTSDTVQFQGYAAIGDGGGATWQHNGVTGQTASQSPAQLANGLLNDASGNQWSIVTDGKPPSLIKLGAVTSQSLGGADSVADSYDIVIALLGWCTTNNYLGVANVLESGYYRLGTPLYVNQSLIFEGKGKHESYFHANHLNGPVIRFGFPYSGLKNIGVTGGATRRAAAYSAQQIGILFEADDEIEATAERMLHCVLENYYVSGQASSAVHIVGPAFEGVLNYPEININKGHGISFDRGELTNRVNLVTTLVAGVCRIGEGRIDNCGGHAIACGDPLTAFSTPVLRVVIDNIEGETNATDAAVRFYNTPVYLRGANHVFENSGLGVNTGGAAAYVAGRNIHLTNNRMLGGYVNAYVVATYDELPTEGIYIKGMSVIGPTAPLDPAVLVTLPAGETVLPRGIHIDQAEMANITELIGTDATMGSTDFRGIGGVYVNGATPLSWKVSDQIVNGSTTLVDDTDLRTWLAPNEKVYFEITIEYESATAADIRLQPYGPSGSTIKHVTVNSLKIDTSVAVSVQSVTTGLINVGGAGPGVPRMSSIIGYCTNGATAGYIGLSWAQLVSNGTDTKVLAGISNLKIERLIS